MQKLIAVTLMMIHGLANAAFEIIDEAPVTVSSPPEIPLIVSDGFVNPTTSPVEFAKTTKTGVIVSGLGYQGLKPAFISGVNGFGKRVSISDVVSQVVPESFTIKNDGIVPLNGVVSWAADNRPWNKVLDEVFRKVGVYGILNWDKKTITISKSVNAERQIKKSIPLWTLKKEDRSLRQAMIRWSKMANYSLDWDVAVDFPISIEANFKGDFESAVTKVMDSLRGSDYPLQACSYENRTIRVIRFGEASRCQ